MRGRQWIPVGVFIAGVACIVAAAATGEAEVQLFIIFPLISGTSWLFALGVVLIVASFVLGFVFSIATYRTEEPPSYPPAAGEHSAIPGQPEKKTRYGGVVLIGPVPIVFGSDWRMALFVLVLAVILVLVVLSLVLLRV